MVTGGAGFIGSHICDELVRIGKDIVVIDDLSTGSRNNIPSGVEFIKVDIRDYSEVRKAIEGVDLVFHVAAQPSTRASIDEPNLDFGSNVWGTFNVLEASLGAKVKKLVYTSSSAVYGEPKNLPMRESDKPEPTSPYGASKLSGELYCLVYHRVYGLPVTCLRPFNVYGARENKEVTADEVYLYTRALSHEESITVFGDGSQTRDFVHVKDVAHAHILAAQEDKAVGYVINIGIGYEVAINELVTEIEKVTGKNATVNKKPWPNGDIYREYADIGLAHRLIGYSPGKTLSVGILELLESLG
jgi:UDP-glucose 4-epimerase